MLLDEAHVMKDKNSYRWKNLMSVAKNARQRLMLTGTPLQNDLHVCFHPHTSDTCLQFMLGIMASSNFFYKIFLSLHMVNTLFSS